MNEQFIQAWSEQNAAGVASLYTEDAIFLAPHLKPLKGRAAVQKYIQGAMNAGLARIELETIAVELHGKNAHEIGQYKLYAANSQVADYGKYMIIWKHQNGSWMIYRDMMNTSRPKSSK